MKVNISKGFDLGNFHYEVESGAITEKQLEADACYGKCDNLNKVIRLTTNFSQDQRSNTFIHECIEAVNAVYCNSKLKHDEINNLGNGLAQILKSLNVEFTQARR